MNSLAHLGFCRFLIAIAVCWVATDRLICSEKDSVECKLQFVGERNLCTGDRSVLLVVDIGEVKQTDSLFGFYLNIGYDRSKIQFNQEVKTNTLSENGTSQFSFWDPSCTSGCIKGHVISSNLNRVLAGKKPLIAFLGRIIDTCASNSDMNLVDLQFGEEFAKEFRSTISVGFETIKDGVLSIQMIATVIEREMLIESDSSYSLSVGLSSIKGLKNVAVNIIGVVDALSFESTIETSLIATDSVSNSGRSIFLNIKDRNNDTLTVRTRIECPKYWSGVIQLEFVPKDDCSCLQKSDTVSIAVIDRWSRVETKENKNEITSMSVIQFSKFMENCGSERASIWNSLGSMVRSEALHGVFDFESVPKGVYLAEFQIEGYLEKKKVLLYNY